MKKVVIIDGHNLLFHMFYGLPATIKNTRGVDIHTLVGFIGSLKKIIAKLEPNSVLVIFDSETSLNNNGLIDEEYKVNRQQIYLDSPNPFDNLELIKKALDYLEIFNLEVVNDEADDYIASILKTYPKYEYIIISSDSDFYQLLGPNTKIYLPSKAELFDSEAFTKKYEIDVKKYVIFKALIGDKADNIKGVYKIGEKTARKIVAYSTLEDFVLKNIENDLGKKLALNMPLIYKNIKLITLNDELKVQVEFKLLNYEKIALKTYEIIAKIEAQ